MATPKTHYYHQIVSEITAGKIHPAYFIYGEETFLIDDLVEKITRKFLGEAQKEMNYFLRYAHDTPLDELLSLTAGSGLFSEKKVIIYKDFQNLRNPNVTALKNYLSKPDPNICLVIIARIQSAGQARYRSLQQHMLTINALPLREKDLMQLIRSEFQKHQKTVTPEAIRTLLYLVGEKIHDLRAEIIQIVNNCGEKSKIEPEDIEKVVGVYVTQNVFELARTIARKDLEKALFILHNLLESGENPGGIMFFLIRHLNMLWKIQGFHQSGIRNDKVIQNELKIYPRQYEEYRQEVPQWPAQQLRAALEILNEADRALKSSQMTESIILDRLVFKLVHLN